MSYTSGQVVHVNGEKYTVASGYKSGSTVPLLNGLKQLTLVSKDKITSIPPKLTKAWAYNKGKVVVIYNSSQVSDGTTAIINEHGDYTLSTINVCISTGDIIRVEKEHLYNLPEPAKTLAKDSKLSVEQRLFVSILIEPSREVVIKSVLDGVDLSLYDEYKGDKYYILVPKKIDKKAPMLMAHT
ncbi:MAG: hypothetical protein JHC33_05350, partial [Ignisphaera sp.]|nr:hypothetical protein [Ignisphaera sp.]